MILELVFFGVLIEMAWFNCRIRSQHRRRRAMRISDTSRIQGRKKPAWVVKEVIRLKALMPLAGCRTVAAAFNAGNAHRGESVGKTFVAQTLKRKEAEVLRMRQQIRNRKRVKGPRNRIWGMDLTFASDGRQASPVLGIVDHGTQRLLCLRILNDRTSIGVLRILLDIIDQYGNPLFLRTDNEAFSIRACSDLHFGSSVSANKPSILFALGRTDGLKGCFARSKKGFIYGGNQ